MAFEVQDSIKKSFKKHEAKSKMKKMAKKVDVRHEGRPMYFEKSTKRGETRLHAK